jgi:hypothetical protein
MLMRQERSAPPESANEPRLTTRSSWRAVRSLTNQRDDIVNPSVVTNLPVPGDEQRTGPSNVADVLF